MIEVGDLVEVAQLSSYDDESVGRPARVIDTRPSVSGNSQMILVQWIDKKIDDSPWEEQGYRYAYRYRKVDQQIWSE